MSDYDVNPTRMTVDNGGAMPQDVEAEASVLSAMMVSAETGIGIERIPLDATDAIALAICHAQKLLHSGLCAAGAGIGKAL